MSSYLVKSALPAALGCVLGYLWADAYANTNELHYARGMYATFGAAGAILFVRVTSLIRTIVADYFR